MFSNKSEDNVKVKMLKANNKVDWSGDDRGIATVMVSGNNSKQTFKASQEWSLCFYYYCK